MVEDQRPCIEDRLDDEFRTIDIRCTDHLDMVIGVTRSLCYESRYILVNVFGEHSLDKEYMRMTFEGLEDAQIVDISVAVEVKVGEHVLGVVQQVLELLYG